MDGSVEYVGGWNNIHAIVRRRRVRAYRPNRVIMASRASVSRCQAGHADPERFAAEFSGSERTVAEYLLAEVLDRQPEEVRRLLLRTSVLERVNGPLADILTGGSGGEGILQTFVVSLDARRSWFEQRGPAGTVRRQDRQPPALNSVAVAASRLAKPLNTCQSERRCRYEATRTAARLVADAAGRSGPEPGLAVSEGSISKQDALWLLAHLVASADICRFEAHYYGTFRLIDAASRLIDAVLQGGSDDPWLRDFQAEIERKKKWMMWDREAYFAFLPEAAGKLAAELKRREAAT
jgi:uncharacterized protein DUF6092